MYVRRSTYNTISRSGPLASLYSTWTIKPLYTVPTLKLYDCHALQKVKYHRATHQALIMNYLLSPEHKAQGLLFTVYLPSLVLGNVVCQVWCIAFCQMLWSHVSQLKKPCGVFLVTNKVMFTLFVFGLWFIYPWGLTCEPCDHITPVLAALQWLLVKSRITFKILLLTNKALIGDAPSYLKTFFFSARKNIPKLKRVHLCNHKGNLNNVGVIKATYVSFRAYV